MNEKESEYDDIFIKESIYPDAKSIFTFHLKSINEIKDDCIFVIDTNSLLVPYTIGKESLDQIRKTYEILVKDKRLIIPGTVAREFAENRAEKLKELYQKLSRKSHIGPLKTGNYPLLESLPEYQEVIRIEEQIDPELQTHKKAIGKLLDHIREWTWNDPVSLIYGTLFTEDIIHDLDISNRKNQIKDDLERRNLYKIPPGYKDSRKDDSGVGDLLIWYTILEIGKVRNKNVIFVSGDMKADWWYKSEGTHLYARYELVDEFRRHSDGQTFHMIKFSDLLGLYGANETIIQEIRKEEEHISRKKSHQPIRNFTKIAEQAVYEWLQHQNPNQEIQKGQIFPHLILRDEEGYSTGVEIKSSRRGRLSSSSIINVKNQARNALKKGELDKFIFVVVTENARYARNVVTMYHRTKLLFDKILFTIIIGYLTPSDEFDVVWNLNR